MKAEINAKLSDKTFAFSKSILLDKDCKKLRFYSDTIPNVEIIFDRLDKYDFENLRKGDDFTETEDDVNLLVNFDLDKCIESNHLYFGQLCRVRFEEEDCSLHAVTKNSDFPKMLIIIKKYAE